jgi:hypothetical protein
MVVISMSGLLYSKIIGHLHQLDSIWGELQGRFRCHWGRKYFSSHFKWINQIDAKFSQVYYLMFMYRSTCFGRPHVHYHELNKCSSSLWFYRCNVVVAVLLVVVGSAAPTALLPPRSNGKNRGCYCSCWAHDDGREDGRNILIYT